MCKAVMPLATILLIIDYYIITIITLLALPTFSFWGQRFGSPIAVWTIPKMAQRGFSTEINIACDNGISLKALSWKGAEYFSSTTTTTNSNSSNSMNKHILLCHGWLDNAATFHLLAPALVQALPMAHVVALDFPGHGHSDHLPNSSPVGIITNLAYFVRQTLLQLQWTTTTTSSGSQQDSTNATTTPAAPPVPTTFTYIGHSMGAAVGVIYAAAFSNDIAQLVLLEGAGPLSRPAQDIGKHVQTHLLAHETRSKKPTRVYPNLAKAVETRVKTVQNYPGKQYLSVEAATQLVLRGSKIVDIDIDGQVDDDNVDDDASVGNDSSCSNNNNNSNRVELDDSNCARQFIHDKRLSWPSVQYLTNEQVLGLYDSITCPVSMILADEGWPIEEEKRRETMDHLKPNMVKHLPGSHHFHADPQTASAVITEVLQVLQKEESKL